VPYDLFGTGVNSAAAKSYLLGEPYQVDRFLETVETVNISGEPFSDWPGRSLWHRYRAPRRIGARHR